MIHPAFRNQLAAPLAYQYMPAALCGQAAVGENPRRVRIDMADDQPQRLAFASVGDEDGFIASRDALDRGLVEVGFNAIALVPDQQCDALLVRQPLAGLQVRVQVVEPAGERCTRLIAPELIFERRQFGFGSSQFFLRALQAGA